MDFESSQSSHIDWSQHGIRKALTASLLHAAHLSLTGISSITKDLAQLSARLSTSQRKHNRSQTHSAISAGSTTAAMAARRWPVRKADEGAGRYATFKHGRRGSVGTVQSKARQRRNRSRIHSAKSPEKIERKIGFEGVKVAWCRSQRSARTES